jgi:hypothetical protein
MTTGLVLAVLAELSWLSLVLPPAAYLLPVVRFPAFAWLIAGGALLPTTRVSVETRGAPGAVGAGVGTGPLVEERGRA